MNVIAYGRSDSIYRTSDGGTTWRQEVIPSTRFIDDISFSSALNGFLVLADTVDTVLTTSDGGLHWARVPLPFVTDGVAQCHDYGNGTYRLFSYGSGRIYTSTDNWQTVDSTGPIVPASPNSFNYVFGHCSFGNGDTILAYGNYFGAKSYFPLIARTIDAGKHWSLVYHDSTYLPGSVHALSDVRRDTIVAGISLLPAVLVSYDRGATWQIDSLIDTAKNDDTDFDPATNSGIGFTADGYLIGSYAFGEINSSIIIGHLGPFPSLVTDNGTESNVTCCYPNPATTAITFSGLTAGQQVHLLDVLGRDVLHSIVPNDGLLRLDVARLPRGIYSALSGNNGTMVLLGKIVLRGH